MATHAAASNQKKVGWSGRDAETPAAGCRQRAASDQGATGQEASHWLVRRAKGGAEHSYWFSHVGPGRKLIIAGNNGKVQGGTINSTCRWAIASNKSQMRTHQPTIRIYTVEKWAEWKWKCCSAMCIPPHARTHARSCHLSVSSLKYNEAEALDHPTCCLMVKE